MLESNYKLQEPAKKIYEPLSPDVYQFQLMDIESKQQTKYLSDEMEDVLNFTFVCLEEGENYGRRIWKTVPPKLVGGAKPSGLYTLLAGLTGKQFSKEECRNVHETVTPEFLNALVGHQVRLALEIHTTTTGKKVNKITSYLPVKNILPDFDPEKQQKDIIKDDKEAIDAIAAEWK